MFKVFVFSMLEGETLADTWTNLLDADMDEGNPVQRIRVDDLLFEEALEDVLNWLNKQNWQIVSIFPSVSRADGVDIVVQKNTDVP